MPEAEFPLVAWTATHQADAALVKMFASPTMSPSLPLHDAVAVQIPVVSVSVSNDVMGFWSPKAPTLLTLNDCAYAE